MSCPTRIGWKEVGKLKIRASPEVLLISNLPVPTGYNLSRLILASMTVGKPDMLKRTGLMLWIALFLLACQLPGLLANRAVPESILTPTLTATSSPTLPIFPPTLAASMVPPIHGSGPRMAPAGSQTAPPAGSPGTPAPSQAAPVSDTPAPAPSATFGQAPIPPVGVIAQTVTPAMADLRLQTTATPMPYNEATLVYPYDPVTVRQHAVVYATSIAASGFNVCTQCESLLYVCRKYSTKPGPPDCRFVCTGTTGGDKRGLNLDGIDMESMDLICSTSAP
jgi:hypothetical protein